MLNNIWIAFGVTFAAALIWLRVNDFLAHRGFISGPLSRKLIHMGTGPIFVLCWLLFPDTLTSRFLAALIPLAITVQFALVGLGVVKDQAAVDAMSRTGQREEILRGPLFYGIVFVVLTLVYWRDSLIGIVALMLLCGGDGLADIVGKRIKSAAIPWARKKSVAGTLAMFAGGWLMSVGVGVVYQASGFLPGDLVNYLPAITVIALAGMMVESLPFSDIDNLTVPAVAVLLGHLLLPF
ncbi:phosphatidate cytidylyltransferase [Ornatilinea apprima]|uniref:Phosphatidate cytidylyltransferase n=1 Tax=Ornatilinea apprima TaxID=1134406 RepID=A0A0P6XMA7_9CHLR|nr:phosphatidate cytidylyltransferase [Ornatilinea apprima]KPL80982.1 phosphatidate cytidylyltransferase [Ornatilinea apprima]